MIYIAAIVRNADVVEARHGTARNAKFRVLAGGFMNSQRIVFISIYIYIMYRLIDLTFPTPYHLSLIFTCETNII